MKLSLEWLSEFVTFTVTDPEEIARRLTAHVGEVDDVEIQGKYLKDCCVGKVLTVAKHPNADKLSLCDVETDKGTKRVVCGGTNLHEGMLVAFAHIGATVKWHGSEEQTLEPVNIRGEKSEGMICAAEELELEEMFPAKKEEGGRPVIDLAQLKIENRKLKIGASLKVVLGMNDVVFHIDNHAITHRADLFSHIGFARECVAIGIAKWKSGFVRRGGLRRDNKIRFSGEKLPFKLIVEEKKLMPRYCACVIEIDGLGETPEWMKKRLRAVGGRPLNLPVDITNYVATEVGVPLHSFDLDDIRGDVHMRKAKEGEKITTLDGKEWKLPAGALILSDDEGIFDMLGIMGGLRSSTKDSTRRIYLHSASLDPVSIRSTVIATGHRTDAATVYEKTVPHITTEQGFLRALQLFLELAPGARAGSKLESFGDNGEGKPIPFSAAYAEEKLGAAVPEKTVIQIFEDLGCTVKKTKDGMAVTPPLWRLKDLKGPHDLVEEVGRVYGFDKIPVTLPEASIAPPTRDKRIHRLRDALGALGYMELIPLSLVGPELLKKCNLDPAKCVQVENPIGEEVSIMQPCVMPQILDHASRNMLLVSDALKTFHIGKIFPSGGGEVFAFGALLASRNETTPATEPFLHLKRDMLTALSHAGYEAEVTPGEPTPSTAHPGRVGDINVEEQTFGKLFEIHPAVGKRFDLPHRSAGVTMDLDVLLKIAPKERHAKALPQFPAITYDVTMTLDRSKALKGILEKIRTSSPLLESVEVADIYSGKPLTKEQYNVTVRCTYRSPERTLTEEEVKREHGKIEMAIQ